MERLEIPLHAGKPPGLSQVFGWVVAANAFVFVTVAIIIVLIPWFAGHQPKLDASTLGLAGAIGLALMIGFLWLAMRRYQQKQLAVPRAHLILDATSATIRPREGEPATCERASFVAEPVHAHEQLRNVDYYLGPALELRIDEQTWVVTHIDGGHRWAHDPRAVMKVDWLCSTEPWAKLLTALELDESLVRYEAEEPT